MILLLLCCILNIVHSYFVDTMEPHGRDQNQKDILQGMICRDDVGDVDVTEQFLNASGEGDESLGRRDGSGEGEAEGEDDGSDDGEADASDEGEADGSGEVHIYINWLINYASVYIHILTLFLLLALRIEIEQIFCTDSARPNQKVGRP